MILVGYGRMHSCISIDKEGIRHQNTSMLCLSCRYTMVDGYRLFLAPGFIDSFVFDV